MSMRKRPTEKGNVGRRFDDLLIPIAFGVLTVLIGVQLLSTIPRVRTTIDEIEGRFVAVPTTVVPTTVNDFSAVVTLSVDNTSVAPDIVVYRNGQSLGSFTTNQMRITVHEGDRIQVREKVPMKQSVSIYVDTDSAKLLLPAPGETLFLGQGVTSANLSSAEFM